MTHRMINGKKLSRIALGCWAFGDSYWGISDDKQSLNTMQKAYDLGINHWDTAFKYGHGYSEKLCGKFLKGKWDTIFYSTKGNVKAKPESIIHQLEQSLGNIKHDHIDLYSIHWPRSNLDMRPYFELLLREKRKGKIGAIGVSNFTVEQIEHVSEVCPIDCCQFGYNLLWKLPEYDIIPYCKKKNINTFGYSSLAQGILTGKFPKKPIFENGDHRDCTVFFDTHYWPHVFNAVERMKEICYNNEIPLLQAVIQSYINNSHHVIPIIGARIPKQIESIFHALENEVPNTVLTQILSISEQLTSHYPNETNIFKWYP